MVDIPEEPSPELRQTLTTKLHQLGFELLDDKRSQLIDRVKTLVISWIHYDGRKQTQNLSDHLSRELGKEYSYLSNLFSEVEGTTIEQFAIRQRIEKAKELITYNELSLTDIAEQLGYSSVAHLSNQFRKITGMTPTAFKSTHTPHRKSLHDV